MQLIQKIPFIGEAVKPQASTVQARIPTVKNLQQLKNFLQGSSLHTVLKIGANWCPPCQKVDVYLPAVAQQFSGRINFLAIDDNTNLRTPHYHSEQALSSLLQTQLLNSKAPLIPKLHLAPAA